MSKPLYFLVWVNGVSHRFEGPAARSRARVFAAAQKALGKQIKFQAVGF